MVKIPDGSIMIYDTGLGQRLRKELKRIVPVDSDIDLMVLSHNDNDHIGGARYVIDDYNVKKVFRTEHQRCPFWEGTIKRILAEDGIEDINLGDNPFEFGHAYSFDDVKVTYVCGYHEPLDEWGDLDEGESNNFVSKRRVSRAVPIHRVRSSSTLPQSSHANGRATQKELGCQQIF